MPTRRGVALLAAAPLLYLLGRATAIGEILGLSAVALVFPIAAVVYVRLRRIGCHVTRVVTPRRASAGAAVEISYEIDGLPLGVHIVDPLPAALGGTVVVTGARTERRSAGARGRHVLEPARATIVDAFGLAWRSMPVSDPATIVIYPRIEVAHGTPPGAREGGGPSLPSRDVTRGDDIAGARPYVDGDDARQIHWRTTARTGELMVRRLEARLYPRATVMLDDRVRAWVGDPSGAAFERAVSIAASAVWSLQRVGTPVALATAHAGPGPARSGAAVTDDLLTALAVVQPGDVDSLLPSIRRLGTGSGGSLLLIAPPDEIPAVAPYLRRLRRRYTFCAAVLIDPGAFARALPSLRADFDRRLTAADTALTAIGWRATYAGTTTPFPELWADLIPAASHPA